MNELALKSEETEFIEPEINIKDDVEDPNGMEVSMENCVKRNEIEEFCKKIIKIEGFKNLLDDQNLKDILKDRTINSLLDDLNLRKVVSQKNWEFEIEIEEEADPQDFEDFNLENNTTENAKYNNDLPINSEEIKLETQDYLEVNLHEIKQENNEDYDINVANNSENSLNISNEIIDNNDQEMIDSEFKSKKVCKNTDENTKVQCPLCEKTLLNKHILQRHISEVHDKLRPFTCTHCDGTFKTKPHLKNHFLKVHFQKNENENENEMPPDLLKKPPKLKTCPHCEETFSGLFKKAFRTHLRTVHPDVKEFQCTDCGKAFRLKANLVYHHKHVHLKVKRPKHKPYKPSRKQCPKCDKTFSQNFALKSHIAVVHEGKIPYVCPQCGKGFKNKQGLDGHIIGVHEGAKKFLCSLCPSSYLKESALALHVRVVHEGLKPFLCTQCGKNFGSGAMLNCHIKKVHEKDLNEVKIRVCNVCQEEFKSKYDLNNHKLIVHEGAQPLMCPQCPMAFARSINLGNHIRNVHTEKKFGCNKCGSKFKTKGILKTHVIRAHTDGEVTWKCAHCSETFETRSKRMKHVTEIHPEKLRKLRLTTNYDTVERVCPHCNETFKNKYFMKKHISAFHL